jgi:ABC-2 type transport system permease protein
VVHSTASFVLDAIPQVSWLHPYLVTHYWSNFADLFRAPIALTQIGSGVYLAAAYIVVGLLAAAARFRGKDITS